MKLTLGFSPCPNDTFIFDALVNGKINTEALEFEVVLEDVQTLNEWSVQNKLDISKISYGVLPLVLNQYVVLNSGGALGKGVGPLLISKLPVLNTTLENATIAIPGENTTAHLLFSLAFPHAKNKVFTVFNKIEQSILCNEVNAGVIIHENRFTYQQKGLIKLTDLGEYWEAKTGAPIPLGGIVAKRSLNTDIILKVDKLIKKSIDYAFNHYPTISSYVQAHAQEMDAAVMKQHIDLYVNNYSLQLGEDGKTAVNQLLSIYHQLHPHQTLSKEAIFVG